MGTAARKNTAGARKSASVRRTTAAGAGGSAAAAAAAEREDDFTGAVGDEMMAGDGDLEFEDVGGMEGDLDDDL
jgi:hypothetical protein